MTDLYDLPKDMLIKLISTIQKETEDKHLCLVYQYRYYADLMKNSKYSIPIYEDCCSGCGMKLLKITGYPLQKSCSGCFKKYCDIRKDSWSSLRQCSCGRDHVCYKKLDACKQCHYTYYCSDCFSNPDKHKCIN